MSIENTTISVDLMSGVSKKDPKNPRPWRAVKLVIGDWTQLIFPSTKFEMDYIETVIRANEKE